MNKTSFFIFFIMSFLLFLSSNDINAQNDYNKTDNLGRRQGKWVDYHENGQVRYKGQFKNNEPIGDFLYYSENGNLIAKNTYLKKSQESVSEMYSENGQVIAKGNYLNKKKNGEWKYFSEKDGSLVLVEYYDNGFLNGESVVYFSGTQNVIEKTSYVNGVKHGPYKKYYDDGLPMVDANYKNDKLDGVFILYYHTGAPKEEGSFKDGIKIGQWKTYDIEGNVLSVDNHEVENYEDPQLKNIELY